MCTVHLAGRPTLDVELKSICIYRTLTEDWSILVGKPTIQKFLMAITNEWSPRIKLIVDSIHQVSNQQRSTKKLELK